MLSKKEKEVTAYHEGGHALVASLLMNTDPVHKVSVISRGRAAGYTMKVPSEDRHLHTKSEFLDDIAMTLGGIAAERLVFNETSTGPSNDLKVATSLARRLVTSYGMSDDLVLNDVRRSTRNGVLARPRRAAQLLRRSCI